jgi:hypothetical protein
MFVVPKGVEHKPCAASEVKLLLIEPRGVLNTGDEGGERPARATCGSDGQSTTHLATKIVSAMFAAGERL